MSNAEGVPTRKPVHPLGWTGLRRQRLEYRPGAIIFAQGDPATSVMYVQKGVARLSVVSRGGKEAIVAVLDEAAFFGEGSLAGQLQRMATATAMAACSIVTVEKAEMV